MAELVGGLCAYFTRTVRAGQALRLARPPPLFRAFCRIDAGLGFTSGNLAPAHFPLQLLSVPIAGKGVTTFRGYPSESGFPASAMPSATAAQHPLRARHNRDWVPHGRDLVAVNERHNEMIMGSREV